MWSSGQTTDETKTVLVALLLVAGLAVHSPPHTVAAEPKAERKTEVWMAVLHERPLTDTPDDWKAVRTQLDGIKFWSGQIDTRTDEALKPFVPLLAKDKIAVAFERMYLPPAKGAVRFIDVDDPMRNLIHPDWPKSFGGGLDRKQAVRQFIDYMLAVRKAEPTLEFFVIVNFPLWAWKDKPSYVGNEFLGDYAAVLELLLAEAKKADCGLRGVTADSPYEMTTGSYRADWLAKAPYDPSKVDWLARLLDLERTVHKAGLEFNLVVNSQEAKAADDCKATLEYVRLYKKAGGKPDRWIVQSWFAYPAEEVVLPESRPGTFAHLTETIIREVKGE